MDINRVKILLLLGKDTQRFRCFQQPVIAEDKYVDLVYGLDLLNDLVKINRLTVE